MQNYEDQKLDGKMLQKKLRIMKVNNWTKCVQDQVQWKEVAGKAKTFIQTVKW